MNSELIQVPFTGNLPSQLADLHSLLADFKFTKDCAAAYLNIQQANMDDESRKVIAQGLWTSAVISYRRGFTTGKAQLVGQGSRLKIPKSWFASLTPEYKRAHEEILTVGNQQIAHYTGAQDNYSVAALLMPPPQPRAIAGVAVMNIGLGTPLDERVRQLGSLCVSLINGLEERFKVLHGQFLELVKAQNLDDLYDDPTRINEHVTEDR